MSSRLRTLCFLTAALAGAAPLSTAVRAKPPDLPVDPTADCREWVLSNPIFDSSVLSLDYLAGYPGSWLFGIDLSPEPEDGADDAALASEDLDEGDEAGVVMLDPDTESDAKAILVQVQETPTGSLLFGAGVNSDAGLTGSLVLNERDFGPCDQGDAQDCAGCACGKTVEVLAVMPVEQPDTAEQLKVMPAKLVSQEEPTPPLGNPSDYTCPYMRQKASEETSPKADDGEALHFNSVLDNLQKLTQARTLYRQGEYYRHAGQADDACRCYEQVQDLCPGSRYAHLAGLKLQKVYAQKANDAAEEASPPDETKPAEQVPYAEPDLDSQAKKDAPPICAGAGCPACPACPARSATKGPACSSCLAHPEGTASAPACCSKGGCGAGKSAKACCAACSACATGEATEDLQATQRLHDARILRWIEVQGESGCCTSNAGDCCEAFSDE